MSIPGGLGRIVDLSVPLSEAHPAHWPTHIPYQHKTFNWYEAGQSPTETLNDLRGPYATKWLLLDEHTGTHVDAPSHFIPPAGSGLPEASEWGDVTADQIPLEQLIGPAAVIDAVQRDAADGHSDLITTEDVIAWEAEHGELVDGEIVLFRTGWDRHYLTGRAGDAYAADVFLRQSAPGWPSPDEATIDLLVSRGIRCIGTDAPTMGPAQGGQGVHLHGLGAGAVFIECLAALDQLPVRGATFVFLPIKTLHGTGAPGRAIAFM